jgi:hypothetical protein
MVLFLFIELLPLPIYINGFHPNFACHTYTSSPWTSSIIRQIKLDSLTNSGVWRCETLKWLTHSFSLLGRPQRYKIWKIFAALQEASLFVYVSLLSFLITDCDASSTVGRNSEMIQIVILILSLQATPLCKHFFCLQ